MVSVDLSEREEPPAGPKARWLAHEALDTNGDARDLAALLRGLMDDGPPLSLLTVGV